MTYAAFAAAIGLLSVWPEYRWLNEDEAIISMTFSHAAERVGECHQLTQAELNELPPNMRKPNSCPRERYPVYIELRADGNAIYARTLQPSGLWKDGKVNVYNRVRLKTGTYLFFVGMNDSGSGENFDFESTATITIEPGQNLVIGFDELANTFVFE